MQIKDLFTKPIGRPINGVIKADQRDEESIWQELDEYVVTKQITEYLRKFFDAYLAAIDNQNDPAVVARMGVWVSGFFGSGKSHFIKILSYLLSNLEAHKPGSSEQRKAFDFFESKIQDPMFLGDMRRAISGKTDVVLFNIDSKADAKTDRDAILQVFLRVFNEMQGLSGDAPHIAEMERYLIGKGAYDAFKAAFKEQHGNEWEAERDAVDFLRDDVIHALGKALKMSEESAGKYFDTARESYKINIEGFADLVRKYLDTKSAGHRVIFLVDEVGQFIGKNAQLMLNLQTITEELGTLCQGRAWVIVTSQEDIDATLGEANQAKSNDFSKITGRFHTRLSLSSSNTDEVIAKRLLEKTADARDQLEAVFKAKGDILNNQLSFSNNAVALRGFKDAADFAIHYPFAPYQFQLLQKVFESIRKVGATGRHLARGERSMLDAFQTAALINGNREADALVPLYDFYPSIESFLDSSVKRAIDQASENGALEPYDIQLLRALFLIRYIPDTVKSSIENLATLCVDQIDADKLALKRKIEASLNRLERQNLVSRNGEFWFFLTNEERDVSQEIKAVDVSAAETAKVIAELMFDEILGGQTKVRHRETKGDYEFNRFLDGAPWRQANQELTFEILSPLGADYDVLSEARCIGRSFESGGRAILRMATDSRIDVEIRNYVQIEKYILSPKAASSTPSLKRILENRKDENRERKGRLLLQLSELMSTGDFYALGQKLQLKPQSPANLLDEIVNYLVSNTYTKLAYIKVRQPDAIAEIRAVLSVDTIGQQNITLGGEDGNVLAMAEMRQYLHLAASTSRVLLSDIVEKFVRAPWGWKPEWEIVLLISRLFMGGEIKLVLEGSDLDAKSAIEPLTKAAKFKQVSILRRKTTDAATRMQARDLHRDLFSLIGPEDEDGLVGSFREHLGKLKAELTQARVKAEQKYFPGTKDITVALSQIDKQLAIRDPFEFLGALSEGKPGWLDLAEDTHDVLSFYKTQTPVWSRMLDGFTNFADNRDALIKDAAAAAGLAELEAIRADPNPYGQINRIDALVSAVETVNDALAAEKRSKALLSVDKKLGEAQAALSAAHADSDLCNKVLKPLQDLKAQLAGLVSIPRILFYQGRGGDLLDEAMEKISADAVIKAKAQAKPVAQLSSTPGVEPPASTSPVSPAAPARPLAKPIRVVKPAELSSKSYLETVGEVEEYVAKLKAELLATIASGHRARIQ
jgi:hypothetical protein